MDLLPRITRQFQELWRGMSPSQRATLTVVPLLVAGAFAFLLSQPSSGGYTAMSWGKAYSADEIVAAEQALNQAGLTDFRRDGQRLMVPSDRVAQYNAALITFDAIPADLGSELLKKYETLGPFSTEKERQELREAMLLQEIRRVIRAVPEVADARVAIANSGRKSWSQKTRVTANVTVWPKGKREVSKQLVHSLQSAVASMVPDLRPNDVTVFDAVNGISHTGPSPDDALDNRVVQRVRELQASFVSNIEEGLSYIPEVGVTVNVDIDNLKSSVTRNQIVDPKKTAPVFTSETLVTDAQQQRPPRGEPGQSSNRPASLSSSTPVERTRNFSETGNNTINGVSFEVTEKELIAAMPRAVQVSVTIPRDYYRSVAAQRKAAGETEATLLDVAAIEKDVIASVSASVRAMIPADSPPSAVIVNSIDRVTNTPPLPVIPWTERSLELIREWGGPAMMVVFAAIALLMLRRTIPKLPPEPVPELNPAQQLATKQEAAAEIEIPKEVTRRDSIQGLVRDNPEATAAIISKWLAAAK